MIIKENFLTEFVGRANQYSSFLILNTSVDEVIRVLNQIDPDMCTGDGYIDGNHVGFIIFKCYPELIYDITERLQTTGYADEEWEYYKTCCARNGEYFRDYAIDWEEEGLPCRNDYGKEDEDDEDVSWDAFIDITDNETGAVFHSGGGAVDYETMLYYKEMVDTQTI